MNFPFFKSFGATRRLPRRMPILARVFPILSFIGCGFFGGNEPKSIALSSRSENLRVNLVSESPNLYRVNDSSGAEMYATAIRHCERSTKPLSGFHRQLFVGMKEIKLEGHEERIIDETPVLYSRLFATVGNDRLQIATLSSKAGNCILDLVAWRPTTEVRSAGELPREGLEELFSSILHNSKV